jgi:hypothetical protein
MRRIVLAGVFPALLLSVPAMADAKRALVIGIDTYVPPVGSKIVDGGRRWGDLDGAANDARAVADLLRSKFGFAKDEIRMLTNREATRAAILDGLDHWLLAEPGKGGSRFFYFAGHGSQVPNSRSREADKRDETLVPADGATGAPDIRDKELRERFSRAVKASAPVTVVLDSCNSGSATRGIQAGKARMVLPASVDVADDSLPPDPIADGALVLSAAQDTELAHEAKDEQQNPHGAFTLAFVRAASTLAADEAIDVVFRKTRALMQANGTVQEPVLGAVETRKHLSLFGRSRSSGIAATLIAVGEIRSRDDVELQGGLADGLAEGCELVLSGKTGDGDRPRVRVTQVVSLGRSRGKIVGGGAKAIKSGDLLRVDRWKTPERPTLSVWVPSVPAALLRDMVKQVRTVESEAAFALSTDPTSKPPTHVVRWNAKSDGNAGWLLESPSGQTALGKVLTTPAIVAALAATGGGPPAVVGMMLPAPKELVDALELGPNKANPAVAVVGDRAQAQYQLIGRRHEAGVEYAWVLPGAEEKANAIVLPLRSDWVELTGRAATAAHDLSDLAARLARVRGWATLESPDRSDFPYQLMLKHKGGALQSGDAVQGGTVIQAFLRAPAGLTDVVPRSVYVFAIDSHGNGVLMFPTGGAVENRYPIGAKDTPPTEIALPIKVRVVPPFGVDTYYLLTSAEPIADPYVLEWKGPRTQNHDTQTRGATNPLQNLLSGIGTRTRGFETVPATWTLDRVILRTVAPVNPPK